MFRCIFIAFLLALSCPSLAEKRSITLVADRWCPYNCLDMKGSQGHLVEKVRQALVSEGYSVDYVEMPWSRAIVEVREGHFDALVGVGRSEVPDLIFPNRPLAIVRHHFYTLPSSSWTYQGLESLDLVRLGVVQNYSYGSLYESYIHFHQDDIRRLAVFKGNNVLPRMIKMLALGRTDAIVEEEQVLAYHLAQAKKPLKLRSAGLAAREAIYVGFSPAIEDAEELAGILGRFLRDPSVSIAHDMTHVAFRQGSNGQEGVDPDIAGEQ